MAADEGVKLAFAGQGRQIAADAVQNRRARRRPAGSQRSHIHAQAAQGAQREALGVVFEDGGQQVTLLDLGGAFRLRQLLGPLQVLSGASGQLRLGAGGCLAWARARRAIRRGSAWGRDPGRAKRSAVAVLASSAQ